MKFSSEAVFFLERRSSDLLPAFHFNILRDATQESCVPRDRDADGQKLISEAVFFLERRSPDLLPAFHFNIVQKCNSGELRSKG